ncbi:MAG: LysR family transcriptional regulator [Rhodoferax sp.]|uniref:LysR family transcriptional regulator n=1 Tax=Rhodoferax sp. TaxID=50421 RepID=UPI0027201E4E|nr:LysR family transcriptional regulator [Rhodoferax sp.]MDO9143737.1 LysR family transcriptional regulator [Rhodoferax sp.]MDP1529596.1 LysR family transcriptional regulator [Rhodoferax sp.]MDP1944939.1 LysR family transcriptional regulator [Rhodoferax sp.]MDP3191875.1 LysR family transcriptional regulator [Rhodoferax sp.]MDP3338547.1 LysR family transcriptional regulator [Rhodoferax sp.]
MSSPITAPSEMAFFSLLARLGSFSATARELNITTPAISKRLNQMEARLGAQLLNRTTRRVSLTAEGELYLEHARRILVEIDDMEHLIGSAIAAPKGLLRVNATMGFGRSHISPIISSFIKLFPGVQVQLQLTVNPPALSEDAFDVCIRFGEPPDARVIAKRIASNRRLLCASPAYLNQRGTPRHPAELAQHDCIGIRQGDEAYGIWHLRCGQQNQTVKVRGTLSSNDGETALGWALDGHGILMRSEWDIAKYLHSGRLKLVLENWQTPPADIYAIYPQRLQTATRVKAFVNYLSEAFATSSPKID